MDPILIFLRALEILFILGALGCIVAIPITAVRMFAVLFEPDETDGNNDDRQAV